MSKIPEEIVFVYSNEEVIKDRVGNKEKVMPACVSDPHNERGMSTAIGWASGGRWGGQRKKAKVSEAFKNVPKMGYRITSIESRGNGGRAYKVISPEGFYIDLREDVVMDIIYSKGIGSGGVIDDGLLFGIKGSQMRLVMADSNLHKELDGRSSKKTRL